jgi:hypothetical protein
MCELSEAERIDLLERVVTVVRGMTAGEMNGLTNHNLPPRDAARMLLQWVAPVRPAPAPPAGRPAYETAEVMLPKGSVYHVQLVAVHPEVWPDLRRSVWGMRDKSDPPFLLCQLDSRDGFIPGNGGRRMCKECEWGLQHVEGDVDQLRWYAAQEIGYRQIDEVTRAFLARVGW